MSIKHLFLDMDDTMTNTNHYITNAILEQLIKEGDKEKLMRYNAWMQTGKTTLELPEEIKDYSYKFGLKEGRFMVEVLKSPLLWNTQWFIDLLVSLKEKYGTQTHVCSHRGWHPDAEKLTRTWLNNNGMAKHIGEVIMLKSSDHPNKLDYLEQHFEDFHLLDDNPFHCVESDYPHDPRVMIYQGIGRYAGYGKQKIVFSVSDIRSHLNDLYHTNR